MEGAHFGFILGARSDFDRTRCGELAVSVPSIASAVELGLDPQALAFDQLVAFDWCDCVLGREIGDGLFHEVRLAVEAARCTGTWRQIGKSNATDLPTAGEHGPSEN